tara:strand:- start:1371 stop:3656 length:2286 start_codon:yes stop_codon:yes gene_type:complete
MNLEDLIKLAGLQKNDTPAVEPQEVEQQVAETPFDGRDNMKAMIALVSPEQLNQLVGDAPIEEEGFANSGDEYAGEPEEYKGTLGSPADLSLRRYLGANGMPVNVDETKVYEDHKVEDISEAYFNYKLDEAPRKANIDLMPIGIGRDIGLPPGVKLPPRPSPMPDLPDDPMPDLPPRPSPMPDLPDYPDLPPRPSPMPDLPDYPDDPTPFPDPRPEPGPPNDPTPFPGPPNDPTPFPGPEPKDPPGEPIPEPKPEPGPKPPTPGGGPEEPPKPKIGDPDEGWYIEEPGKAEEPKDPIDTKIDPKDVDGDSPADPKDPNWDLKLDALGRNIQTSKEREEMFQKYGLTPPRDVLKAQMKREQDRRDRTNKVGFDKLYNDRADTLNSTYVSQRDENGNIIDPNPKESTMNEEPNEGNEFTGALANAKKAGKKEFKVDGKTYQVEAVEQLHADMNRMRKLSGLTESTIMEKPKNPAFDPFGGAPGDEGEDPIFDPFGGAPGDEGEDPMGGMGEPGGPADPPAGTRPPDPIGPTPTPPASGTRPPDPIGPQPTPADPPAGTRPPDPIGPQPTPPGEPVPGPKPTPPENPTGGPNKPIQDPPMPQPGGGPEAPTAEKPKAPVITPQMRKDAEEYADRDGLPRDQLGTIVSGTVGGIPTTLEVDPNSGVVIDTKTGDVIGGDDADAAREAAKGRTPGLGPKPDASDTNTSAPKADSPTAPKAPDSSGDQKLPNGMTVAQAKRLAKLAGYTDEQIAAYEKRAKEQGLIK